MNEKRQHVSRHSTTLCTAWQVLACSLCWSIVWSRAWLYSLSLSCIIWCSCICTARPITTLAVLILSCITITVATCVAVHDAPHLLPNAVRLVKEGLTWLPWGCSAAQKGPLAAPRLCFAVLAGIATRPGCHHSRRIRCDACIGNCNEQGEGRAWGRSKCVCRLVVQTG